MIKKIIFVMVFLGALQASAVCQAKWEDMTKGISNLSLQAIAVDPADSNVIFVGAEENFYRSSDGGDTWENIFTVYGDGKINFIAVDKKNSQTVYMATSNGLFRSFDRGAKWKRIFKGMGEEGKELTCVLVHPFDSKKIYAGTKKGLFVSADKGNTWIMSSHMPGNAKVNFLAASPTHPDILYTATAKGVFKTVDMGKHWNRIFITGNSDEETGENENDYSEDEESVNGKGVSCIEISSDDSDEIYIGTQDGIFVTRDGGKLWQNISSIGLGNTEVKAIAKNSSGIYAATDNGVFRFNEGDEAWQNYSAGITAQKINMLALDARQANLWSVGDGGVFRMALQRGPALCRENNSPAVSLDGPAIREIQQAAIKYAEVSSEKIKRWRAGARYRSLFPEFSLDYDKTVTYDSGADRYYIGPYDWGVSVKWDLADLIWNPYQKDIDIRSRLMVQLRDDILDEVTHLYYERRRLQAELMLSPPTSDNARVDKELQLQELTAGIDALTDGYLSERIRAME